MLIGALLGAGVMWAVVTRLDGRSTEATTPEPETTASTPPIRIIATGQLPDGSTWALSARAAGPAVCTRLVISSGGSLPGEDCDRPPPPDSAFGAVRTRTARGDPATFALTWGIVSLATERVRFSTADGVVGDVRPVGAGTGIGVRFFVAVMPRNVPSTLVAFGASGQELSRVELVPVPPR